MRISDWSSDVCSSDLDEVDAPLGGRVGSAAEGERDAAKAKVEQPIAALGLEVIVALRRRPRDELDLPVVEPEPFVGGALLRLDRAVVRQKDALRAALDDGGRDAAFGDVGEALGGEHHRYVLLAKHLQTFEEARGEQGLGEEQPGLDEHAEGGGAVDACLET